MTVRHRFFCPNCRAGRLFRRREPKHTLHLYLTLSTLGFWGPVWLVLAWQATRRRWRCGYCLVPVEMPCEIPEDAVEPAGRAAVWAERDLRTST